MQSGRQQTRVRHRLPYALGPRRNTRAACLRPRHRERSAARPQVTPTRARRVARTAAEGARPASRTPRDLRFVSRFCRPTRTIVSVHHRQLTPRGRLGVATGVVLRGETSARSPFRRSPPSPSRGRYCGDNNGKVPRGRGPAPRGLERMMSGLAPDAGTTLFSDPKPGGPRRVAGQWGREMRHGWVLRDALRSAEQGAATVAAAARAPDHAATGPGVEPRQGARPAPRADVCIVRVYSRVHLERAIFALTCHQSKLRCSNASSSGAPSHVLRRRRAAAGRRHRRGEREGTRDAREGVREGSAENASIPPTPIGLGPLPRNLDLNAPNVRVPVSGGGCWSGRFRVQQTVITKISSVASPPFKATFGQGGSESAQYNSPRDRRRAVGPFPPRARERRSFGGRALVSDPRARRIAGRVAVEPLDALGASARLGLARE